MTACLSDVGDRAILLGNRTEIVTAKKRMSTVLPGNQSDCSFNRSGPVFTQNSVSYQGHLTTVAQYDHSGKRLWSHDLPIAASLSTASDGENVVLSGSGVAKMYDSRGDLRLDLSDVSSAMLASARKLVLLDGDGQLRWQDIGS